MWTATPFVKANVAAECLSVCSVPDGMPAASRCCPNPREAWRSMKDNRVGLSFGYMTVKSQRRDGINDLLELDLYEISIAPGPINPRTRILEMKSAAITERELRRRCDQLALEAALGWEPLPVPAPEPAAKSVPTDSELRQRAARLGVELPPSYLETVRAEARDHMLACLQFELRDGQGDHR
jgi:hypothetical protein